MSNKRYNKGIADYFGGLVGGAVAATKKRKGKLDEAIDKPKKKKKSKSY